MHGMMRDRLERILAKPELGETAHLDECAECRDEIGAMREHAAMLKTLRASDEVEARPGFYARVMERIEAQRVVSIWNLVFESQFGRRIAMASMALALMLGVYLVTSERMSDPLTAGEAVQAIAGEDQPGMVFGEQGSAPDRDSVLVNLVTYQER